MIRLSIVGLTVRARLLGLDLFSVRLPSYATLPVPPCVNTRCFLPQHRIGVELRGWHHLHVGHVPGRLVHFRVVIRRARPDSVDPVELQRLEQSRTCLVFDLAKPGHRATTASLSCNLLRMAMRVAPGRPFSAGDIRSCAAWGLWRCRRRALVGPLGADAGVASALLAEQLLRAARHFAAPPASSACRPADWPSTSRPHRAAAG